MVRYLVQLDDAQEELLLPLLEALAVSFQRLPAPLPQKDHYSVEEITAFVDTFPEGFRWTVSAIDDYLPKALKVGIQLIQNELFIMPAPTPQHQRICEELGFQFGYFLRQQKTGRVLYAPVDVVFDENNLRQPDIIVILMENYAIMESKRIVGAPDLIVEIWSAGNPAQEQAQKQALYATHKVNEYWQVFPDSRYVRVEVLDDTTGNFRLFSEAREKGVVNSQLLSGFSLAIEDLFTHP
ncbi:MAG: Uma2 family endonuclease [Bernardetiaceae bacterium]